MTDVLAPGAGAVRPSTVVTVAAGLVLGATVGVAARAWMRLVSSDPEFSWSGTTFIVMVFAFAGLTQGIALAARRRRWSRWAQLPLRLVAGFGGLLLGSGAGIVMLPAMVGGSLAVARTDWPRAVRAVAGGVAIADTVAMWWLLAGDLPLWRLASGWVLMLPLYAVVIAGLSLNLRPLPGARRDRIRRSAAVQMGAAGALAAVLLGFSVNRLWAGIVPESEKNPAQIQIPPRTAPAQR